MSIQELFRAQIARFKRAQLAHNQAMRRCKRTLLLEFRQKWALQHEEYECVGGPRCGETLKCVYREPLEVLTGYYEFDASDCRLHFHCRRVTSTDAIG